MASILVLIFDFILTQLLWVVEHSFSTGAV